MKLRGRAYFPRPERILLIQPRRIGDVLLCTPAIRALASHFPEATIDFIVEPPADEALWGHPLIDRRLVPQRDKSLRSFLAFVRRIRQRRYDWAIDFFTNPRSAQYVFLSGARTRVGLDRLGRRWAFTHHVVEDDTDQDAYAVDLRLDILQRMGVPAAGRELEVYADHADPSEAARAHAIVESVGDSKRIIAVATGSANPAKRYPADLTAHVIEGLLEEDYHVVLTAGPGETAFAEQILSHLSLPISFLAEARVPTLAALYRRVHAYVGPDSGPKHIAVACRLPTVTIFGPGRPSNWNDPGNARNRLIVAPCTVRPNCVESECAARECLRKIDPLAIVQAVEDLLTFRDESR